MPPTEPQERTSKWASLGELVAKLKDGESIILEREGDLTEEAIKIRRGLNGVRACRSIRPSVKVVDGKIVITRRGIWPALSAFSRLIPIADVPRRAFTFCTRREIETVEVPVALCEDSLHLMASKTPPDLPGSPVAAGIERRQAPRYRVVAIAELTDPEEGKMVSGKLTQISRKGCYVDTPKTFPVGTSLKVIISRDERTFVAKASIIHVQERMGMGLAFQDALDDQMKILDSWLAELPSTSALA